MQSVLIVVFGIAGMCFGWFIYSKFIASKIFQLDPDFVTPSHELNDGVDYVPTNKVVLWGHHFTSVAGAAPIVGPAIAIYWGWLPALLWVVLGTIFFAGVHDMGALWASVRHKGKSMAALSESVIGKKARSLFMIVIFLLLLMVNAVFALIIAGAFVDTPEALIPAWGAILVALIIGQLVKRNFNLTLLTIVGVVVLYSLIYFGSNAPISLPDQMFGLSANANWIIILFIYAGIASMLPVWMLLQPRDYINGMQLIVGLILLYGAVLLFLPSFSAPAINDAVKEGTPSMIPILFVTIACGAVSGFHGIVSSGTSSKQLNKETDARFVGYLGALGEGSLALITIVAVGGAAYAATTAEWHQLFPEMQGAAAARGAFVTAGASLISEGWGFSQTLASTLLATLVILFAGTTMDSGVRLQRYIIQEWGEIFNIKFLRGNVVATLIAVGTCLALAFSGGSSGAGGMTIWPLFGATNQILASLTLLVISVFLIKLGRPVWYTLVPMVLVLIVAFWAGCLRLVTYFNNGQWLLVVLDVLVLVVSILVMLEALSVIATIKKEKQANQATSAGG